MDKFISLIIGGLLVSSLMWYFSEYRFIDITYLELYDKNGETRVLYKPEVIEDTLADWRVIVYEKYTGEHICSGGGNTPHLYMQQDTNVLDFSLSDYVGGDCPNLNEDSKLYTIITIYTPVDIDIPPEIFRHHKQVQTEKPPLP